jgi:hypothetical protein
MNMEGDALSRSPASVASEAPIAKDQNTSTWIILIVKQLRGKRDSANKHMQDIHNSTISVKNKLHIRRCMSSHRGILHASY